jgi:hypothetical protein
VQIRTEAGPRLHIEPPLDYSEDFESCGDVTDKANEASGDYPQVGLASAHAWGCGKTARLRCSRPSGALSNTDPFCPLTHPSSHTLRCTQNTYETPGVVALLQGQSLASACHFWTKNSYELTVTHEGEGLLRHTHTHSQSPPPNTHTYLVVRLRQ